ncbi:hypothetical protein [Embleya scabrispora]|uniref:hypothetical protein n=1 Tax=Embleya scabrispora TaxID=159449 RepID=UPI00131A13FA|nr:hypothetical protein [Embleya scabrispora]MYS82828.1 hypothetical protein [Streptomyces sp. SID5474]
MLTWSTRNWEIVSAARSRVVTAPGQSAYFTFPGVGPDGRTVATADPLSLRTWTINVDDAIN